MSIRYYSFVNLLNTLELLLTQRYDFLNPPYVARLLEYLSSGEDSDQNDTSAVFRPNY